MGRGLQKSLAPRQFYLSEEVCPSPAALDSGDQVAWPAFTSEEQGRGNAGALQMGLCKFAAWGSI